MPGLLHRGSRKSLEKYIVGLEDQIDEMTAKLTATTISLNKINEEAVFLRANSKTIREFEEMQSVLQQKIESVKEEKKVIAEQYAAFRVQAGEREEFLEQQVLSLKSQIEESKKRMEKLVDPQHSSRIFRLPANSDNEVFSDSMSAAKSPLSQQDAMTAVPSTPTAPAYTDSDATIHKERNISNGFQETGRLSPRANMTAADYELEDIAMAVFARLSHGAPRFHKKENTPTMFTADERAPAKISSDMFNGNPKPNPSFVASVAETPADIFVEDEPVHMKVSQEKTIDLSPTKDIVNAPIGQAATDEKIPISAQTPELKIHTHVKLIDLFGKKQ